MFDDFNILRLLTDDGERIDELELKEITVENFSTSGNSMVIEGVLNKTASI
jgi:hypothetical protein